MAKTYLLNLDFETGGFNGAANALSGKPVNGADYYPLLEVSAVLLDKDLNELCRYESFIQDEARLGNANPETIEFHKKNRQSETGPSYWHTYMDTKKHSLFTVEERIISMLLEALPDLTVYSYDAPIKIILTGHSVHFDRDFINLQLPRLSKYLSHQHIDVSGIITLHRLWHPTTGFIVRKSPTHFATDDTQVTTDELHVLKDWIESQPYDCKYLEDHDKGECSWSDIGYAIASKIFDPIMAKINSFIYR